MSDEFFKARTMTSDDVQKVTGFSKSYIWRLTREGKLTGVRKGREYEYTAGAVNKCFGLGLQVMQRVPNKLSEVW